MTISVFGCRLNSFGLFLDRIRARGTGPETDYFRWFKFRITTFDLYVVDVCLVRAGFQCTIDDKAQ